MNLGAEESYGRFSPGVYINKKDKKGFFASLIFPGNGCFYQNCLSMQPFQMEFNNNIFFLNYT